MRPQAILNLASVILLLAIGVAAAAIGRQFSLFTFLRQPSAARALLTFSLLRFPTSFD